MRCLRGWSYEISCSQSIEQLEDSTLATQYWSYPLLDMARELAEEMHRHAGSQEDERLHVALSAALGFYKAMKEDGGDENDYNMPG